jgi:hypothetical protein
MGAYVRARVVSTSRTAASFSKTEIVIFCNKCIKYIVLFYDGKFVMARAVGSATIAPMKKTLYANKQYFSTTMYMTLTT